MMEPVIMTGGTPRDATFEVYYEQDVIYREEYRATVPYSALKGMTPKEWISQEDIEDILSMSAFPTEMKYKEFSSVTAPYGIYIDPLEEPLLIEKDSVYFLNIGEYRSDRRRNNGVPPKLYASRIMIAVEDQWGKVLEFSYVPGEGTEGTYVLKVTGLTWGDLMQIAYVLDQETIAVQDATDPNRGILVGPTEYLKD